MAALSDQLLVATILAYLVAMLAHAAEFAFGHRSAVGRAALRTPRQVAAPVRRRQQHEVDRLDDPRQDPERDPLHGERRLTIEPPGGHSGRDDADRRRQHPHRCDTERIAGCLEPDVPRDVEAGTEQDERDDERVHARTLPGADPRSLVRIGRPRAAFSRAGRAGGNPTPRWPCRRQTARSSPK